MRTALALVVGLFVVGCSHADVVSDDPRLAVLERVHPNGHIPALDHHNATAVADDDLAPTPSSRSKTSLVAKNDTDLTADDVNAIVGPSSKASAADDAFNGGSAKSKKSSAKAKKTHHHSSHHQTQQ